MAQNILLVGYGYIGQEIARKLGEKGIKASIFRDGSTNAEKDIKMNDLEKFTLIIVADSSNETRKRIRIWSQQKPKRVFFCDVRFFFPTGPQKEVIWFTLETDESSEEPVRGSSILRKLWTRLYEIEELKGRHYIHSEDAAFLTMPFQRTQTEMRMSKLFSVQASTTSLPAILFVVKMLVDDILKIYDGEAAKNYWRNVEYVDVQSLLFSKSMDDATIIDDFFPEKFWESIRNLNIMACGDIEKCDDFMRCCASVGVGLLSQVFLMSEKDCEKTSNILSRNPQIVSIPSLDSACRFWDEPHDLLIRLDGIANFFQSAHEHNTIENTIVESKLGAFGRSTSNEIVTQFFKMLDLEKSFFYYDEFDGYDTMMIGGAEDVLKMTAELDVKLETLLEEYLQLENSEEYLEESISQNKTKIAEHKKEPLLVSRISELIESEETYTEVKTKCVVIKTSTRASYFLPVVGLVDSEELKPGDLVGVNKDSYLILEKLPAEYDSRVKAMEVDERPTEQYADIGGCDKQIQELIEAVVLPMTHKDRFVNLGIHPPKGVLMYGPPGTGKTMMARAVAAQTNSTFLKLAGPQLVQMCIGDGAKLVRDAFALAKEKAPAIIFIDELDAIGTKRFDSEKAGDRDVQRTMLELLNQLDGFQPNDDIKIIAATNRIDVLDPALLRSGRLDRKIELPHPNEDGRARIMQIHSRKMNVNKYVNFEELARCTDDFNGAQCKAVCVEAGMIALRRDATEILHEDFTDAIQEVANKRNNCFQYFV